MAYSDRLNGILEEQDFKLFSAGLINERKRIESLIYELKSQIKDFSEKDITKKFSKNSVSEVDSMVRHAKEMEPCVSY